jgi:hypothetical protein
MNPRYSKSVTALPQNSLVSSRKPHSNVNNDTIPGLLGLTYTNIWYSEHHNLPESALTTGNRTRCHNSFDCTDSSGRTIGMGAPIVKDAETVRTSQIIENILFAQTFFDSMVVYLSILNSVRFLWLSREQK